jgi:hypothetical protein
MDPVTLINQAHGLGLALSVAGGKINITGPRTAAAAALVQRMAPHKSALIELLTTLPADQPDPTDPDDLPYGDLTNWVGATVSADTLAELEAECCRRHEGRLVFTAKLGGNGWRVTRLASAGWQR